MKDSNTEYVVLLHGLTKNRSSMFTLEKELDNAGFRIINVNYPSTKYPIEKLSSIVFRYIQSKYHSQCIIHFVTHSLGGIVLRQYLSEKSIPNLGNIVMLGPPNKGSHVINLLKYLPGFKKLTGPAGVQLGTENTSLPNKIGPASFNVGIIAGSKSKNRILSLVIPGKNDGKISVENTKIENMSEHLVLPVAHKDMPHNKDIIKQTLNFIQTGQFNKKLL